MVPLLSICLTGAAGDRLRPWIGKGAKVVPVECFWIFDVLSVMMWNLDNAVSKTVGEDCGLLCHT
jgi:hypothetical protein